MQAAGRGALPPGPSSGLTWAHTSTHTASCGLEAWTGAQHWLRPLPTS